MNNQTRHISLYIGHAYDLVYFLRLVPLIRAYGRFTFSAVVAMDPHLNKIAGLSSYLDHIASDYIMITEDQVPRLGKGIAPISKLISTALQRIDKLINKADLFISLDKSQLLPHILLNKFHHSILIQTFEAPDLTKDYTIAWKSTVLANIYHSIFGAKWKIIRVNKKSTFVSHHHVIRQKVEIIFRNGDKSLKNRIVLPPLIESEVTSKKVILFGSRFLSWDYFTKKMTADLLKYYKELSSSLPGYTFLYKPHPAEMDDEFKLIRECFPTGNIENIGYDLSSELVLLTHPEIDYCFSLGSTSSLSALEMGFKSYVIYKLIGFPDEIEGTYDSIFHDAPANFFLNDTSDLQKLPPLKSHPGYLTYFLDRLSFYTRTSL
ncbi:polysialyltransferase family glycosyltransferase [Daejeonella lutea]|uniref:Uncharacterized protein n=1 Tax=Daejeonella lutea TaxID=572036 RepID=A0A1T5FBY1_9SPHI|nr:polysialyltransferase family glycosyltransferase [Daejeonella lutea]SKB93664.1 hypothetical protein SAMN05661099_3580 [Daejeonella lutea]